jgi:hypothetical protein
MSIIAGSDHPSATVAYSVGRDTIDTIQLAASQTHHPNRIRNIMPSKPLTMLIVLGWLSTLGWFAYRELWPALFPGDEPEIALELPDEVGPEVAGVATRLPDVRWTIYRDDHSIGRAETRIHYNKEDDTFEIMTRIVELKLNFGSYSILEIHSPGVTNSYRITRAGLLRQVRMEGDLEVYHEKVTTLFTGTVHGDLMERIASIKTRLLGSISPIMESVPAPKGTVLNPMHPVPKLKNVRPGRRWRMPVLNPVGDAVQPIAQAILDHPFVKVFLGQGSGEIKLPKLPSGATFVDAEVLDDVADLNIKGEISRCFIIQYRTENQSGSDKPARTYVRIRDGAVMRQEAYALGTLIALQRE